MRQRACRACSCLIIPVITAFLVGAKTVPMNNAERVGGKALKLGYFSPEKCLELGAR